MKQFDCIIVGAGSAGCVMAARLSEDPNLRVLLIEAGPSDRRLEVQMPMAWTSAAANPAIGWGYATAPEPHANNRQIPQPRGRVLGGTSSINGMMYTRGQPSDYNGWAASGLDGWDYESLRPYFKRAEASDRGETQERGGAGAMRVSRLPRDPLLYPPFIQAAKSLGYEEVSDFTEALGTGFGVPDFSISNGSRQSSADAYLAQARKRSNLTIQKETRVTRVLLDGRRATGVELSEPNGRLSRVMARQIVLSAGTFNSPQLLLQSGIGPAEHLRACGIDLLHELNGVGENLHDHPMVHVSHQAAFPVTFERTLRADRLALATLRWLLTRSGPAARQPFALQGFVPSHDGVKDPDLQIQITHASMQSRPWFPGWRRGAGHQFSTGILLLRPTSRGRLRLDTAHPTGAPIIRFNLLETEEDRLALRRGIRTVRRIFGCQSTHELVESEIAPSPEVEDDVSLDAFIRGTVMTGMHPVGTCAMGTGPQAVVDNALRVQGIEALCVVDCSVMPKIVSGNTSAPAIAIAERAADILRQTAFSATSSQSKEAF